MITETAGPLVHVTLQEAPEAGDSYGQTKALIASELEILKENGCTASDVIRARMYVTASYDRAAGRKAYSETFLPIRPTYTVLTVEPFENPKTLVTFEMWAIRGCGTKDSPYQKENFSSGAPFEAIAGYSRMVKAGPVVVLGGTTSVQPDGSLLAKGDGKGQETYVVNKAFSFLKKAGAGPDDVVCVRRFVTPQYREESAVLTDLLGDKLGRTVTDIPIIHLSRDGQYIEIEMTAILPDAPDWAKTDLARTI